ncbi:MAG: hypothetical protein ACOCUK_00960 [bacterium]
MSRKVSSNIPTGKVVETQGLRLGDWGTNARKNDCTTTRLHDGTRER